MFFYSEELSLALIWTWFIVKEIVSVRYRKLTQIGERPWARPTSAYRIGALNEDLVAEEVEPKDLRERLAKRVLSRSEYG